MNKNLIAHKNPKSPISESYRMLRTNLRYLNIDEETKVVAVTSSNPAEGKTTTLCNLAITIAQAGQRVVLVDADMRKPRLHKTFTVSNNHGVVDILVEKTNYKMIVQQVEGIENLELITSGAIPPDPSELLESKAMVNLIAELKKDYDFVLVDAPPICSVTDAAILARLVDGVILVVASGETKIDSAKLSKKLLEKVDANILGVVLSKADTSKSGGYYYYYYEYGDDEKSKKKHRRKKKK